MSTGTTHQTGRSSRELEEICRETLSAVLPQFRRRRITARFYPYIGLTHTMRRKGAEWEIRVSDHCRAAPRPVLEAIALLLGCKLLRRRVPRETAMVYARFREDPAVERAVLARRAERGSKRIGGPKGAHHSLDEICREINEGYFNNQVELIHLGWGKRASWGRLGHYDDAHRSITISPVLDSPEVPRWVLSYLLYHEMLHAIFAVEENHGSRRHHPPGFRSAEDAYPDSTRARKFLNEYCRGRGRATGRA